MLTIFCKMKRSLFSIFLGLILLLAISFDKNNLCLSNSFDDILQCVWKKSIIIILTESESYNTELFGKCLDFIGKYKVTAAVPALIEILNSEKDMSKRILITSTINKIKEPRKRVYDNKGVPHQKL